MYVRGLQLLIKINKHIWLVDYPGFKFPYGNCLLIEDDTTCLIDNSSAEADLSNLMKKKIDLIINSHGHLDHYFHNHQFPDSRILMHPADQGMAGSAKKYLDEFGLYKYATDPKNRQMYLDGIHYHTSRIDDSIQDGQTINLGGTQFEVLHLPGHSMGHCGFFFPEQGFVFTADIELSAFGPWYGNLGSTINDFINSIDRLLLLKPDYLITGHGEGIVKENISRRLINYRDIIYQRQQRIIDLIKSGRHTLDELARACPVYIRFPRPEILFYLYEKVMILIHLRHLQGLGDVFEDEDRYYLK